MTGGFAPGRQIILDAFIIGDYFQDLSYGQFLDSPCGEDDWHRTKETECIELRVSLYHQSFYRERAELRNAGDLNKGFLHITAQFK